MDPVYVVKDALVNKALGSKTEPDTTPVPNVARAVPVCGYVKRISTDWASITLVSLGIITKSF